jgi:hypothetical protein
MVRKSDEERLKELEEQMNKIKTRKQQLESRVKEKERKERTKRLIEVGAIFEKYFDMKGQEEAEKLAIALKSYVTKNREQILSMTKDQLKEWNHKRQKERDLNGKE